VGTLEVGGRTKDLTCEWNGRATTIIFIGLILLATGYTASLSFIAPHASTKIIPGWSGDLSLATVSSSSLGRVTVNLSDAGMNITIAGNSTGFKLETFYGVKLPVVPPVNCTQLPFLEIRMKTSSVYVAGTVALQLDAGRDVTIIQKTYNTRDWHEEIVLLKPFFIPPDNSVINLMLGFRILKSPSAVQMPTVEFSRPIFGYSSATPVA
jgi:hypothetical protein